MGTYDSDNDNHWISHYHKIVLLLISTEKKYQAQY